MTYIPPLAFPLRITEAHPTPHPRSDLWDANGMFIANISTAWAVQIRDVCQTERLDSSARRHAFRLACNIQCQGCREDWELHKRTPAVPGAAELYHVPTFVQAGGWVAWPMDCQAWRIRKAIDPEEELDRLSEMNDEEVLAECRTRGEDPGKIAQQLRAIAKKVLKDAGL